MSLKEIREKLGLTQSELAQRLGVSQNYVAQIEIGRRSMRPALMAAAEALVNKEPDKNIDNIIDKRLASIEARLESLDARVSSVERLLLRLLAGQGGGGKKES